MRSLRAEYIPLVRSQSECKVVRAVMGDVDAVRVAAHSVDQLTIDQEWRMWIDPSFDGYEFVFRKGWSRDKGSPKNAWSDWIRQFDGHDLLTTEASAASAPQTEVDSFVAGVLDSVAAEDPLIISVPQLPYSMDAVRHRINKKLAKAAGMWKGRKWPSGTFILPAVLLRSEIYRTKTPAMQRINAICRSLELSHATGVWVVHAGFNDLEGKSNYDRDMFPSLIQFHELLNEALPAKTFTCAGPYWAINLILWARGIVDVPVISGGGPYSYDTPKPYYNPPTNRIALPPLRRRYGAKTELRTWVRTAIKKFPASSEVRDELRQIEASFAQFLGRDGLVPAMLQTAQFYHSWLQQIAAFEPLGRGLFMFQDFSRAVVNGAHIREKLPKQEHLSAKARDPGFIAEQLMLQCLPR